MDERITTAKNRGFETANGIPFGKSNPISMPTHETSIYRITGMNQLKDILICGYVRPREGKLKGGHTNEIFWSKGSDKLFYYDKDRIILEAPTSKVTDGQIGAIHITDLIGIWQFNNDKRLFENRIDIYQKFYDEMQSNEKHKAK